MSVWLLPPIEKILAAPLAGDSLLGVRKKNLTPTLQNYIKKAVTQTLL